MNLIYTKVSVHVSNISLNIFRYSNKKKWNASFWFTMKSKYDELLQLDNKLLCYLGFNTILYQQKSTQHLYANNTMNITSGLCLVKM